MGTYFEHGRLNEMFCINPHLLEFLILLQKIYRSPKISPHMKGLTLIFININNKNNIILFLLDNMSHSSNKLVKIGIKYTINKNND